MNTLTCTRCKVEKSVDLFKSIRGKMVKQCSVCREKGAIAQKKARETSGYQVKKCPHDRERRKCVDCGGSQVCEHRRQRSTCVDCVGSQICVHRRHRNRCIDCEGCGICHHGRERYRCNECTGYKAVVKKTIYHTREADRKSGKYNPDLHVDKCFLEGLFEDSPDLICPYCTEKMSLDSGDRRLVTIERINNDIGHIKSNCILACYSCNVSRVGQRKQ